MGYFEMIEAHNNRVIENHSPVKTICRCCKELKFVIEYVAVNKPKPDFRLLLICSDCNIKHQGENVLDVYNKY